MATGFSVFVNIGGKVNPSLASAVSSAKAQITGLGASLAGVGVRANAAFAATNASLAGFKKRAASIQTTGRNMALAVTAPAMMLGRSMLQSTVELEKAKNFHMALGDATREEADATEELAYHLAGLYDVGGVKSIVEATSSLMKAGFNFAQSRGALEQVLATTVMSHGEMTTSQVGDSIAKIINQFKLPMATYEETMDSATKVSDRMVYAANATTANMVDMAQAFKFAGSISATMGNSLDATTASIIAMAKSGVLGSEAGVAMRSAIVRLIKPTNDAVATMARIGLSYDEFVSKGTATAKSVISNLKVGGITGIEGKGFEREIDQIIKKQGKGGTEALVPAITSAVQRVVGDSSAIAGMGIADHVRDALTAGGSKVDVTQFFTKFKKKIDEGKASYSDFVNVLEGRMISRNTGWSKENLFEIIDEIQQNAEGYAKKRAAILQQGLPLDVLQLDASWERLRNTLVRAVAPEISNGMRTLARGMTDLGKTNPGLLRLGLGAVAVTAVAGPLMFALGGVGKALVGVASGAAWLGGALGVSAGAVLAGAAVIAGAGLLIYQNWDTIKDVWRGFSDELSKASDDNYDMAEQFRNALNPPDSSTWNGFFANISKQAHEVGDYWSRVFATPEKAQEQGKNAAQGWNFYKKLFTEPWKSPSTRIPGPIDLGPMFGRDYAQKDAERYKAEGIGVIPGLPDYTQKGQEAGNATADGFKTGAEESAAPAEAGASIASKIAGALRAAFTFSTGDLTAAIVGKRALGGPVSFGKPYLVGERGPELFTPGRSGSILANDRLRQLTADGTAAIAGSSDNSRTMHNHVAVNVSVAGGDARDVRAAAEDAVYRALARLQSDQQGLLSD